MFVTVKELRYIRFVMSGALTQNMSCCCYLINKVLLNFNIMLRLGMFIFLNYKFFNWKLKRFVQLVDGCKSAQHAFYD